MSAAAAAAKTAAAATVKYIWRFPRPKKDRDARLVLFTAYEATMRVEKNPSKILLRADIHHGWRWHKGKYIPDKPHITASYQTPALEGQNDADIHRGRKWHEHEGKYVPDAPHITASYQTPALEATDTYETLHGYVAAIDNYLLTKVQKGRTNGTMGDKGWPKGAEANRQTESHRGISWKVKQSRYDPPRITTSYQTPALEATGQYRTLHGYVRGMRHYPLKRVGKGRTPGTIGDKGWPKGAEAGPQEQYTGILGKVKHDVRIRPACPHYREPSTASSPVHQPASNQDLFLLVSMSTRQTIPREQGTWRDL